MDGVTLPCLFHLLKKRKNARGRSVGEGGAMFVRLLLAWFFRSFNQIGARLCRGDHCRV